MSFLCCQGPPLHRRRITERVLGSWGAEQRLRVCKEDGVRLLLFRGMVGRWAVGFVSQVPQGGTALCFVGACIRAF
jgi:hypothetical protein